MTVGSAKQRITTNAWYSVYYLHTPSTINGPPPLTQGRLSGAASHSPTGTRTLLQSRLRARVTKVCGANLSSDSHLDCHSPLSVSLRYLRREALSDRRDAGPYGGSVVLRYGGSKPPPYGLLRISSCGNAAPLPTLQSGRTKALPYGCNFSASLPSPTLPSFFYKQKTAEKSAVFLY